MRWTKVLIPAAALAVGLGAGAGGVGLLLNRPALSGAGPGGGSGMMGGLGGMMGGGADIAGGAPGGLVPARQMAALAATEARTVLRQGSTLTYRSHRVRLVALGAPGARPGMYWQVDGAINPTVSVPAGSVITVDFADGDPGQPHGFELTTAAPPYARMAMMAGPIAAPGAFIMPVPPPKGTLWYAATVTFRAPAPGTYYYLCPVPGHAQQGMWGKLIVR